MTGSSPPAALTASWLVVKAALLASVSSIRRFSAVDVSACVIQTRICVDPPPPWRLTGDSSIPGVCLRVMFMYMSFDPVYVLTFPPYRPWKRLYTPKAMVGGSTISVLGLRIANARDVGVSCICVRTIMNRCKYLVCRCKYMMHMGIILYMCIYIITVNISTQ